MSFTLAKHHGTGTPMREVPAERKIGTGNMNHGRARRYAAGLLTLSMLALFGAVALAATAGATGDNNGDKVWVCKYVGAPGDFETLKAGKQPIQVDDASTGGHDTVGSDFADGQFHSVVIDVVTESNTDEHNDYTGEATCPVPEGTTTTTTAPPITTTTTEQPTTTTTTVVRQTTTTTTATIKPVPPTTLNETPTASKPTLPFTGASLWLLWIALPALLGGTVIGFVYPRKRV